MNEAATGVRENKERYDKAETGGAAQTEDGPQLLLSDA